MKRVFLAFVAVVFMAATAFSQSPNASSLLGANIAANYGNWAVPSTNAVTAASGQVMNFQPASCLVTAGNKAIFPFNANAPITVSDGANTETVTPSAASLTSSTCSLTATFSSAHGAGVKVSSGTGGLQEAINNASGANSFVWVTGDSSVTTAFILAAAGSANVGVIDIRGPNYLVYQYLQGAYVSVDSPATRYTAAGGYWAPFVNTELVTLATGATTTDTSGNLLPANSYLDSVIGVVNTTITSACTGWELGDATTAARFTANDTTLTAGEAKVGSVMLTTGVASATTGPFQSAAAKVRITCAGGNPGAGKVRVTTFGRTFVPSAN